jgi:hypothetical protein
MELLPNRTDSTSSRLLFLEFGLEERFQLIKFFATGLSFADVESVVLITGLEYVGLEHFV